MKNLLKISVILLFVISFSSTSFSQSLGVVGKIFTKAEANQKLGKVLSTIQMSTKALEKIAEKASDYILIKVKNGHLIFLNRHRKVISGLVNAVSKTEKFHLYSTSKLLELIKKGGSPTTTFEVRPNGVLSITNASGTLDYSVLCPPVCP